MYQMQFNRNLQKHLHSDNTLTSTRRQVYEGGDQPSPPLAFRLLAQASTKDDDNCKYMPLTPAFAMPWIALSPGESKPTTSQGFTGHDPVRGSCQEVFERPARQVGSGQEVFKISLVESGRVRTFRFVLFFFAHFLFPGSGQAVVTGVVPSPRLFPLVFIAHRIQQSYRSSIFYRVLLTHALALSAGQFVRKKKSPRVFTTITGRVGSP